MSASHIGGIRDSRGRRGMVLRCEHVYGYGCYALGIVAGRRISSNKMRAFDTADEQLLRDLEDMLRYAAEPELQAMLVSHR